MVLENELVLAKAIDDLCNFCDVQHDLFLRELQERRNSLTKEQLDGLKSLEREYVSIVKGYRDMRDMVYEKIIQSGI